MEYNTRRTLESYQYVIDLIKKAGHNLIGVCQMMMEDTFIFETKEEADKAYEELELEPKDKEIKVSGFWYSKDEIDDAISSYEKNYNYTPKIYWL